MDDPAHVESVSFGASRYCYVPSAHKLYGVGGGTTFVVWDTQGDTALATFNRPCGVSGMCLDHTGDYIYCAGYGDTRMLVISVRADSVIAEFDVPITAAARDPLAISRRTGRIYEAEYDGLEPQGFIPVVRDSIQIGLEQLVSRETRPVIGPTLVRRAVPFHATAHAELFDASGRRVAALRLGPNDIGHLARGIYFGLGIPDGRTTKIIVVR